MSTHIVEVCTIESVREHPNADALFLATVKGWQFVIGKKADGTPHYAVGEKVVYIPIASVLNREFADKIGVTKYLSEKTNAEGERVLVVRQAKLRGEPSFGIVIAPEDPAWAVGQDVADFYGIKKYNPPIKTNAGDAESPHPLFDEYTGIENMRNFPSVIASGEDVVVTEKIHGTNSRVGWIDGDLMAGSHGLRRKRPDNEADWATNTYWFPLTIPGVRAIVERLGEKYRQVVLYGEVFGSSVQSLAYGCRGRLGYRAFDLKLDGKFVDHDAFVETLATFGIEVVPVVYRGGFEMGAVKTASAGNTTLADNHIREGVVVKPTRERHDEKIGRVILKYIGDDYLFAKGVSDSTDV